MKNNRIPSLAIAALLAAALVAAFTVNAVAASGTADVQARILEAEQEARGAVRDRAGEFRHFIVGNNSGARPFAEEIIGWYGTCRTAWGYVGGDGYEAYLDEAFGRHVFSESDVAVAMRRAIENAIRDIDEIENELAVELGVLIEGRPLSVAEMATARDAFRHAIGNVAGAAQWDLAKTVGRMTAAERIGGMTTKIMARFGGKILKMITRMIEKKIQKQILKTIAKKAVKKVGVKVVEKTVKVVSVWGGPLVCFTVSIGVDVAIEWIDDPAADVAADVRSSLWDIGYKSQRDIIAQFDPILTQRRRSWEQAAEEMLK